MIKLHASEGLTLQLHLYHGLKTRVCKNIDATFYGMRSVSNLDILPIVCQFLHVFMKDIFCGTKEKLVNSIF